MSGRTKTVVYRGPTSVVICSLRLSQRTGGDPAVLIVSPGNIIPSSVVKINSATTMYHFVVHDVKGGSLVDYVNSIAMCLTAANIPCDVSVAAEHGENMMIYSPQLDKVDYVYCENINNKGVAETLKNECLEVYKGIHRDE